MDTNMIIEAIGYIGSGLVLVSFLMVSVVKLRIINSIGSIIFTAYALIIHSYPTAIMNFCLVLINIYYLIKLKNADSREYNLLKTESSDSLLLKILELYTEDIKKCFPGISMNFSNADLCYVICHKGNPVGFFIGKKDNDKLNILLDYSIPEYRDFSIGSFIFSKLPHDGIRTVIFSGDDSNHKAYLKKTGFVKSGSEYIKNL
ncbi:MAG: hypothetical protein K6A23_00950 [Butyrivibrio sp.]|nr:hypothetical protein [Butyrivibrio sp.]